MGSTTTSVPATMPVVIEFEAPENLPNGPYMKQPSMSVGMGGHAAAVNWATMGLTFACTPTTTATQLGAACEKFIAEQLDRTQQALANMPAGNIQTGIEITGYQYKGGVLQETQTFQAGDQVIVNYTQNTSICMCVIQ